MKNDANSFSRIHATAQEKKEMYEKSLRISRFGYEEFEALAKKARSREEYEFYSDKAHWAFKSAEALEFGP